MISNATILRLDPADGPDGDAIAVHCAMTPLTTGQQRMSDDAGWNAIAVLYIPLNLAPEPRPVAGNSATIRPDVEESSTRYAITHVVEQMGHALAHIQVYLAPTI